MTLLKAVVLGLLVAMVTSYGVCDTVVYQQDFSAPFVQHDWVYNNSGNQGHVGYPGNIGGTHPWPAMIGDNGQEVLGYSQQTYYATNFEDFTLGTLAGQDPHGWVGSGTIDATSHSYARGVRFTNESAYRNFGSSTQSVQYVQCYVKCSYTNGISYIYTGLSNLSVAAAVRFNNTGKIEAHNGDGTGAGGGTWVALADYVAGQWYRITIKLNYAVGAYSYRVAVQGGYNDTDLGFQDSAAAVPSGLQSVGFDQNSGSINLFVDDVYAGNSPYAPGQDLRDYWTDSYNHWCIDYGGPIHASYDIYDWMSCSDLSGNPVNTDTDKALPYKASLPTGWTAAFQPWADMEPQSYVYSGRGKMGFTRLKGQYAQSPDNACLHVWSSHGVLRVVSPNISTGPGVYTLTWRGGVWNLNTADPNMQYRWTDWCSWGFGYTNWSVWDPWNANQGFVQTLPPFPKSQDWMGIGDYWQWPGTPFHASHPPVPVGDPYPEPAGYLADRTVANGWTQFDHPAGEEPGQWHTFTSTFAFGVPPEVLVSTEKDHKDICYPGRGYYIGFEVAHGHDPGNAGYQWGTILNVDDIVLTKKDPVEVDAARKSPVGTLVEVANVVVTNVVFGPPDLATSAATIRVFLENQDRSGGIMLRAVGTDAVAAIKDKFHPGDVVRVIGAISKDDPYDKRVPQPDTKNPVGYITNWTQGPYLPTVLAAGGPQVNLKPVAVTNKSLAGSPAAPGLGVEGMLVTVFGMVNHSKTDTGEYFYLDDGSGLPAGKPESGSTITNATGVRIDCRTALATLTEIPANGTYASVTGAYATEMNPVDHSTVVRVVYPRTGSDIVSVVQP